VAASAAAIAVAMSTWVAAPPGVVHAQAPEATTVKYPSGSTMIEAYMAKPPGASKSPAVIVVHDDLGLNDRFRELARQFAQAGFVALAPHLPSRVPAGTSPPQGRGQPPTAVARLTPAQALEDLRAAFAFLQKDPAVDATRISAIGAGWGEYRVWKLAEQTPALYRAVVFYGITPTDDDRLKTLKTPVMGHYAQQDYLATARVLKTKKLLGNRFTYHIYPTSPGFIGGGSGQLQQSTGGYVTSLRGSDPQAMAAAAKQALTRTMDFLKGAPTS
jgi:carboxymethylenebutenolidase